MKLHILNATHWNTPGIVRAAHVEREEAEAAALEMVKLLIADHNAGIARHNEEANDPLPRPGPVLHPLDPALLIDVEQSAERDDWELLLCTLQYHRIGISFDVETMERARAGGGAWDGSPMSEEPWDGEAIAEAAGFDIWIDEVELAGDYAHPVKSDVMNAYRFLALSAREVLDATGGITIDWMRDEMCMLERDVLKVERVDPPSDNKPRSVIATDSGTITIGDQVISWISGSVRDLAVDSPLLTGFGGQGAPQIGASPVHGFAIPHQPIRDPREPGASLLSPADLAAAQGFKLLTTPGDSVLNLAAISPDELCKAFGDPVMLYESPPCALIAPSAESVARELGAQGEHETYTKAAWREDDTVRGYWDWVAAKLEQDADEAAANGPKTWIITSIVTASVEETWTVTADTEEEARDIFDNDPLMGEEASRFISHKVIGDEEAREVRSVVVAPDDYLEKIDNPERAAVVIDVTGGIVQAAWSDRTDIDVITLDYDVEGDDADNLIELAEGKAYRAEAGVTVAPQFVRQVVEAEGGADA